MRFLRRRNEKGELVVGRGPIRIEAPPHRLTGIERARRDGEDLFGDPPRILGVTGDRHPREVRMLLEDMDLRNLRRIR